MLAQHWAAAVPAGGTSWRCKLIRARFVTQSPMSVMEGNHKKMFSFWTLSWTVGGWGPEVLNFLQCYEESSQIKSLYQCLKTVSRSRPTIPAMYWKVLDSPFTFLSCRRMFGHGGEELSRVRCSGRRQVLSKWSLVRKNWLRQEVAREDKGCCDTSSAHVIFVIFLTSILMVLVFYNPLQKLWQPMGPKWLSQNSKYICVFVPYFSFLKVENSGLSY